MKFNEILVKNILNKYIYDNKLIGGDNQILKLPDLYTKDKSIGIEVTMCELDVDYCINELKNECEKYKNDYNKCIQIRNKYERKEMFSRLRSQLHYNVNNEESHIFKMEKIDKGLGKIYVNQDVINIGFVPYIFAKMYENKLKKLNRGNYDGVKSKNLVISSLLRERSSDLARICFYMFDLTNSMFVNRLFDKTYLIYRRGIYIFGQDRIEKFIKIDEKDLKKLLELSIEEYKNSKGKNRSKVNNNKK